MKFTEENIAYRNFMYNRQNEHNCEACPENKGMDDGQNRLPCGQQHCWVTAHCNPEKLRA